MRRVISLALFRPLPGEHRHGDAHTYFPLFLPAVLRAARAIFPGWEVWIHHDEHMRPGPYGSALRVMHDRGLLRLVDCGRTPALTAAMLWRLHPVFDQSVEYVLCRDLDGLPIPRERMCVERWIAARTALHAMHDHPGQRPAGDDGYLPGGLMDVWAPAFREQAPDITSVDYIIAEGNRRGLSFHAKGDDQVILNALLRRDGLSSLVHPYDPQKRRAKVRHLDLPDVHPEVLEFGDGMCEHMGGVFDVAPVAAFYDKFETSGPIIDAEREVGWNG